MLPRPGPVHFRIERRHIRGMSVATFDTLAASRALRDAGADERLAEAVARVVAQATSLPATDHLAAKTEVEALRIETKGEFAALRSDIKGLSERVTALQGFIIAGIGFNTTTVIASAGFLYAVLK